LANSGVPGSSRLQVAAARVRPRVTVRFGARTNGQVVVAQAQTIAVFAAVTAPPIDANTSASIFAQ
jgi:hypothetical protein